MLNSRLIRGGLAALLCVVALPVMAQSFRVQCPAGTTLHPATVPNSSYDTITRPLDTNPTTNPTGKKNIAGKLNPTPAMANAHIKCQQLSGGDGFATMGDGTQTYLFAFGPLSGLSNIVKGLPGTVTAQDFFKSNLDAANGALGRWRTRGRQDRRARRLGYTFNGAIGLVPDPAVDNQDRHHGHILRRPALSSRATSIRA